MKVLWFSASVPSRYTDGKKYLAGWQDSLEQLVRSRKDIELAVAFPVSVAAEHKEVDGVWYYPIYAPLSRFNKFKSRFSAYIQINKQIEMGKKIIENYSPDIIQVFGTEFGFGLLAKHTEIPVVVHILGAMIPYDNAKFPPGYNNYTYFKAVKGNLFRWLNNYVICKFRDSRVVMEGEVWKQVKYYMGRTDWDKAVSSVLCPGRYYYHVDEALRPDFLSKKYQWTPPCDGKLRIVSTGCGTLWKGLDMMLKTAKILKEMNVEFEWNVCGRMPNDHRQIVEYHEHTTFKEAGINLLGMTPPDKLAELLAISTLYVHTSYIDNSPNSICEAQCIGIPVISTNVGGISSLVANGVDGILVPANDPYQMAYNIVTISKDERKMKTFSENAKLKALERHNPDIIIAQLYDCYNQIKNERIK